MAEFPKVKSSKRHVETKSNELIQKHFWCRYNADFTFYHPPPLFQQSRAQLRQPKWTLSTIANHLIRLLYNQYVDSELSIKFPGISWLSHSRFKRQRAECRDQGCDQGTFFTIGPEA